MKIQLIKETNIKGEIMFSVEVDGRYVDGSAASDEQNAIVLYEKIKSGMSPVREVVKSEEV